MLGFIIAVAGGALTPMIETPLARPAARALSNVIEVEDTELRLLAFMLAMLIVAILCAVFNTGSTLGLVVGGMLGYFGGRLARWAQRAIEEKRG